MNSIYKFIASVLFILLSGNLSYASTSFHSYKKLSEKESANTLSTTTVDSLGIFFNYGLSETEINFDTKLTRMPDKTLLKKNTPKFFNYNQINITNTHIKSLLALSTITLDLESTFKSSIFFYLANIMQYNRPHIKMDLNDTIDEALKIYQNPSDTDGIIQYFSKYQFNDQEKLLFLIPMITSSYTPSKTQEIADSKGSNKEITNDEILERLAAQEMNISSKDIINLIKKSKINPNTKIGTEIEILYSNESEEKNAEMQLIPIAQILNSTNSNAPPPKTKFERDRKIKEDQVINEMHSFWNKKNIAFLSLSHEIIYSNNKELIEYFFSSKDLNPNVHNLRKETPVNLLFSEHHFSNNTLQNELDVNEFSNSEIERIYLPTEEVLTFYKNQINNARLLHKINPKINWKTQNLLKDTPLHNWILTIKNLPDEIDKNKFLTTDLPFFTNDLEIDFSAKNIVNETPALLAGLWGFKKTAAQLAKKTKTDIFKETNAFNYFVSKNNYETMILQPLNDSFTYITAVSTYIDEQYLIKTHHFDSETTDKNIQSLNKEYTLSKNRIYTYDQQNQIIEVSLDHFFKNKADLKKILKNDDLNQFKKLYQKDTKFFNQPIEILKNVNPMKNIEHFTIHVSNILLLAIKYQSLEIVEFLLKNTTNNDFILPPYKNSPDFITIFQDLFEQTQSSVEQDHKENPPLIQNEKEPSSNGKQPIVDIPVEFSDKKEIDFTIYPDPLSEAIMQLSFTNDTHLKEKNNGKYKKALKIFNLLLKDQRIINSLGDKNNIHLTPIETAILVNSEDAIKTLNEQFLVTFPKGHVWNSGISFSYFLEQNNNALLEKIKSKEKDIGCKKAFLN